MTLAEFVTIDTALQGVVRCRVSGRASCETRFIDDTGQEAYRVSYRVAGATAQTFARVATCSTA